MKEYWAAHAQTVDYLQLLLYLAAEDVATLQ